MKTSRIAELLSRSISRSRGTSTMALVLLVCDAIPGVPVIAAGGHGATGEIEAFALYAGQSVGLIRDLPPSLRSWLNWQGRSPDPRNSGFSPRKTPPTQNSFQAIQLKDCP